MLYCINSNISDAVMDRLQSMRVFQRVVSEGGFAAAARALDLSPAVVTRLVADLEEHLGVRLLQRTTRRMALTEAGKLYAERLRGILDDIDDADARVSRLTEQVSGVLRIASPPLLASYVLAPAIADFQSMYPGIRIDLDVGITSEASVEDHDITLLGTEPGFDANVIARHIATTDAVLVAAPEYLASAPPLQQPEDLAQHRCLTRKLPGLRSTVWRLSHVESPGTEVEVAVDTVLWVNQMDVLMQAALEGAGVACVSLAQAAPWLARGNLQRVLEPWTAGRLSMYAALPSRKFMPRRTQLLLDFLTVRAHERPPYRDDVGCGQ